MNILATLWADLMKVFAFAPVVAALDPNASKGIAVASAAVAALQPTVAAIHAASDGTLTHEQLVEQVTTAVASSSSELSKLGIVSSTTDAHLQAAVPLINAAVAVSGLAAQPAPTEGISVSQVRG